MNKAVPPIILALVTGMILDHVLRAIFGSESLGPLVGNIEGTFPLPIPILLLPWDNDILSILSRRIPDRPRARGGGSMKSLLSAATLNSVVKSRHDGDRELVGQGLGNMVAACFGSVPSTGAPAQGLASYNVGGRSRPPV